MSELLDAALGYARRGWAVMPLHTPASTPSGCSCYNEAQRSKCTAIGKHPRIKTGVGHSAATRSERQIREWWRGWPDANIGLATGAVSGISIVDIDGPGGFQSIKQAGHELPDTLGVVSGRKEGGEHRYFRYPGFEIPGEQRGIGILPKVDFISNKRLVVAPPSLHQSGKKYDWLDADLEVLSLPEWMIETLKAKAESGSRSSKLPDPSQPIPEGMRREVYLSLTRKWRAGGLSGVQLFDMLLGEDTRRGQPPMQSEEGGYEELKEIAFSAEKFDPDVLVDISPPAFMKRVEDAVNMARDAGATEATIAQIEKQGTAKATQAATQSDHAMLTMRVVRRRFLEGHTDDDSVGAEFDCHIAFKGRTVTLRGLPVQELFDYKKIRMLCMGELLVLPSRKDSAKVWAQDVEALFDSGQVKDAGVADSLIQDILRSFRDFLLSAQKAEDLAEVYDNPGGNLTYTDPKNGTFVFRLDSAKAWIEARIKDAKRANISKALGKVNVTRIQVRVSDTRVTLHRVHPGTVNTLVDGESSEN